VGDGIEVSHYCPADHCGSESVVLIRKHPSRADNKKGPPIAGGPMMSGESISARRAYSAPRFLSTWGVPLLNSTTDRVTMRTIVAVFGV
jgi:hypothetical protein